MVNSIMGVIVKLMVNAIFCSKFSTKRLKRPIENFEKSFLKVLTVAQKFYYKMGSIYIFYYFRTATKIKLVDLKKVGKSFNSQPALPESTLEVNHAYQIFGLKILPRFLKHIRYGG